MDQHDYIKKWIEGSFSEDERQAFENSADFQSLKKIYENSIAFKSPEYHVEKELARFNENKHKEAKVVTMKWLAPLLRVAAILVVVFGVWIYFFTTSTTTIQTLASEKSELYLPDSSHVFLNAFSVLSYKPNNWEKERSVSLEGEAFFKVAKGSKFDVETPGGLVSVLGTQFNVRQRDNVFEVVCYEGLVQVKSAGKTITLEKTEVFRVRNGEIDDDKMISNSPSWIANESLFKSTPFSEVIDEFERQYGVTIQAQQLDLDQLFTGGFAHNNLTLALESITQPLNISYKIKDNKTIVLSGDIE
ncbi:FecR family protein [Fulvivirgaceae bacterium BMA10]|uniref:FecR family protein n=1 Tax=Splendidivirga corallicola TaxID=3051826 RepID=A0ABT8KT18_9BACT|nr:FecR family protein [Fulvivirgaceae bacterium BMA10]